jgi:O-antigen ligase
MAFEGKVNLASPIQSNSVVGVCAAILLALPWLNPFASGPSSAVIPLLFSWACAAALVATFALSKSSQTTNPANQLISISATAWLIAASVSAAIGLLQYFGATTAFGAWVSSTPVGTAFGNLRQRNQFASLTSIGLAALLWWAARGDGLKSDQALAVQKPNAAAMAQPAKNFKLSGFSAGWLAALLAAANAASASRTGLVQVVLLVGLAWLWGGLRDKATRRVLTIAVVAYAVASFVLPLLVGLELGGAGILSRMQDKTPACGNRMILWTNVLHLIGLKPWWGWGWGNLDFAHFVTLYPGARFCDILDNAHNLPLHLAVEFGIPVALAVCGGGVWWVWRAKPWRETAPARQMAWSIMAVILLHSLLEYPLWYGPFQIAFVLCILILRRPGDGVPERMQSQLAPTQVDRTKKSKHVAAKISAAIERREETSIARVFAPYFAMLLIVFIVYAWWDYYRVSQIYRLPHLRDAAYQDNTMKKIRGSWLFSNQVAFAELTTAVVGQKNAAWVNASALELLHFSPEARVAIKLIESAVLLGHDQEALFFLARLRAAFPEEHAKWMAANRVGLQDADPSPEAQAKARAASQ